MHKKNSASNRTIFSMNHPWDKESQVCSENKVPGVIHGHPPREHNFI